MKESAQIALTYVRSPGGGRRRRHPLDREIHSAGRRGAKDGPSAGVDRMVTALVSLALAARSAPDVGTTGEVDHYGWALLIGG